MLEVHSITDNKIYSVKEFQKLSREERKSKKLSCKSCSATARFVSPGTKRSYFRAVHKRENCSESRKGTSYNNWKHSAESRGYINIVLTRRANSGQSTATSNNPKNRNWQESQMFHLFQLIFKDTPQKLPVKINGSKITAKDFFVNLDIATESLPFDEPRCFYGTIKKVKSANTKDEIGFIKFDKGMFDIQIGPQTRTFLNERFEILKCGDLPSGTKIIMLGKQTQSSSSTWISLLQPSKIYIEIYKEN